MTNVKELVNAGASMLRNNQGKTPLYFAAFKGHTDVMRYLLSKNADPDTVDDCGNTALHISAARGDLTIVEELVNAGASMLQNNQGVST